MRRLMRRLMPMALAATLALLLAIPALAFDPAQRSPHQAASKPLDINSASRAQLMMLPGIGGAEADRIIAARPYPSKAKLLADKVLSDETYRALKGRIVALPKATPGPQARADRPPPVKP